MSVYVPEDFVGYVNGFKGVVFRGIEEDCDVFCFMADDVQDGKKNKVFIFGLEYGYDSSKSENGTGLPDPHKGREAARFVVNRVIREKVRLDREHDCPRGGYRGDRRRDDSRDRCGGGKPSRSYKGESRGNGYSKGGDRGSKGGSKGYRGRADSRGRDDYRSGGKGGDRDRRDFRDVRSGDRAPRGGYDDRDRKPRNGGIEDRYAAQRRERDDRRGGFRPQTRVGGDYDR